ncbi:unnamed protein product [Enterobius vermicularis]|uniref:Protein kinase domain-containing protein n=1 Tax=Enterobius vermicularis TaxID=51028 RepID=A0A0N4V6M4_ENTVE|nr:unnamed protein product [Enterobius vermicularis]
MYRHYLFKEIAFGKPGQQGFHSEEEVTSIKVVSVKGYTILETSDYVCVLSKAQERILLNVAAMHHLYLTNDRQFYANRDKQQHETFLCLHTELEEEKKGEDIIAKSFLCQQMPTGRWVKLDLATSSSSVFNNMVILSKLQNRQSTNLIEALDFTKHYRPHCFEEFSTGCVGWLVVPNLVTINDIISFRKKKNLKPVLTWEDIGGIIWQMINGLEFIHRNNIVHMQICGKNVFCDSDLNIKIGNFHCARSPSALKKLIRRPGGIEKLKGIAYLYPPELYSRYPQQTLSGAVDIWGLGMFAMEMFLGVHPLESLCVHSDSLRIVKVWNQNSEGADYQTIFASLDQCSLPEDEAAKAFLGMTVHTDPKKRGNLETLRYSYLCDVKSKLSAFHKTVKEAEIKEPHRLLEMFRKFDDVLDENLTGKILEYLLDKVQNCLVSSATSVPVCLFTPEPEHIAEWIGVAVSNIFKFCCLMQNSELTREQENVQILLKRGIELCVYGLILIATIAIEGVAAFATRFMLAIQRYFDDLIQLKQKSRLRRVEAAQMPSAAGASLETMELLSSINQQLKQQGQQPLLQNTVPLKLEGYLADINENQFTKKRFPWSSPDYDFCILQFCSSLEASIVAASEREFRVRNKLMAVGEIKNWDSFISSFLPIIDCKIDSSIIATNYLRAAHFLTMVASAQTTSPDYIRRILIVRSRYKSLETSENRCHSERVEVGFQRRVRKRRKTDEFEEDWSPLSISAKNSASSFAKLVNDDETKTSEYPGSLADTLTPTEKCKRAKSPLGNNSSKRRWRNLKQTMATVSRFHSVIAAKKAFRDCNSKLEIARFRLIRDELFRQADTLEVRETGFPNDKFLLVTFDPWPKLHPGTELTPLTF